MKNYFTLTLAVLIIFGSSCGILKSAAEKQQQAIAGNRVLTKVDKASDFKNTATAEEINAFVEKSIRVTINISGEGNYKRLMNDRTEKGKIIVSEDAQTLSMGKENYQIQSVSEQNMVLAKGDYLYTFENVPE